MDPADLPTALDSALQLPSSERVLALVRIGRRVLHDASVLPAEGRGRLVRAMAALVDEGVGQPAERVDLGDVLGWLGDPRLTTPEDAEYWVAVGTDDGSIRIGRNLVTNAEFRRFADEGAYGDRRLWSEEGWAWLSQCSDPWPEKAKASDAKPFIVPNQPVVAVTWYEAEAYARRHDARLPRFDERMRVVRGTEKRPYPWGSPFGEGHANTREEVLGRPCAVGLYVDDRTPEGVFDLAGNVAEWAQDGVGAERWYHPGAWDQPSMAAWAKARELERPSARWAGLGFRLARD